MKIGNFDLNGPATFIIAELSANHGGDIDIAKRTIDAAKEAGADAVKLQTYRADTITLDCNRKDFIIGGETLWDGQRLYDLYKEASLPWEWHAELFEHARERGLEIFSSPFDKSAVDFLETFSPCAYKIASFEITDYGLIRYAAAKGRPMIISTGIATIQEIQDAVDICREEGNTNIALLQCTSSYPAPLEEANLNTIPNMRDSFGVVAGFSDHTLGISAPVAAVALGAKIIEKHFILDKSIGGPDAGFSLDREEFGAMVRAVRETEKLLGNVNYSLTERKRRNRRFARSLYVAEEIRKGEIFTENNLRSVRPGYGLHPKYLPEILGKRARCDLQKGTPMKFSYVEETCETG
ncbi:pseudaminic acid synthase [Hydrogenimonas sp. SS33]|uniref:pseudaminic acid synthase n=1 Tax=Hydrogenimonas leucolamina TaxID=2954236 RepID=UPI00336BBAED